MSAFVGFGLSQFPSFPSGDTDRVLCITRNALKLLPQIMMFIFFPMSTWDRDATRQTCSANQLLYVAFMQLTKTGNVGVLFSVDLQVIVLKRS